MVGIQFVLSLGQVVIYTADLRLVYQIKKQEPSDEYPKISEKLLHNVFDLCYNVDIGHR